MATKKQEIPKKKVAPTTEKKAKAPPEGTKEKEPLEMPQPLYLNHQWKVA